MFKSENNADEGLSGFLPSMQGELVLKERTLGEARTFTLRLQKCV